MPDSHQNLSCLRSGVEYPRFTNDDTTEELLTPLLRQLNFWCECGITDFKGTKLEILPHKFGKPVVP